MGGSTPARDVRIQQDGSDVDGLKKEIERLQRELDIRDQRVRKLEEGGASTARRNSGSMMYSNVEDDDEILPLEEDTDDEELVKPEPKEPVLTANEPESGGSTTVTKSGASLGLMVSFMFLTRRIAQY